MTAVVGCSCMARPADEQGGCRDFFQFLCRLAPHSNSEGRERGTDPTGSTGEATLSAVGGRRTWAASGQPPEGAMSDLLLIDDDPGQLVAQVRQAFPAPGHRIVVAGTGAEGVARVRAAPPDVV